MTLLALSDLHGVIPAPGSLPDAHAALVAGDLTNVGVDHAPGVEAARQWMDAMVARYGRVFWIPGNHDIGIRPEMLPGVCLLDGPARLDDLWVAGIALTPCFDLPQLARYWVHMTEDPALDAAAFEALPPAQLVVSHGPPLGALDRVGARSIGSPGLLSYVRRHAPRLVVCGHCHEGAFQGIRGDGQTWIGDTLIVNVAGHARTIELGPDGAEAGERWAL